MIRVNIRELIRFYDEDRQARHHANAIKAVAGEELNLSALVHYLESIGERVELCKESCTTGARSGSWLDAWLRVSRGMYSFYYQVEVKSWSFHGAGGRKSLSVGCTDDDASRHCIDTWAKYWDHNAGMFCNERVRKVLTRMRCPTPEAPIFALLCLWEAVHPEGKFSEPFFPVRPSSGEFDSVYVFSTSNYLRQLLRTQEYMDLHLPKTSARFAYLKSLFPAFRD